MHIGPKFAGARNDCRIQRSSRTIEVRQRLAEATAAGGQRLREAVGVSGRLGHARTDMRSGNERRVPDECNPGVRNHRRHLEVEDRLDERLAGLADDLGERRGEQPLGIVAHRCHHFGPNGGRGNRQLVELAAGVGQKLSQIVGSRRPIPDEIEATTPARDVFASPGNGVAEHLLARRQAEREVVADCLAGKLRQCRLFDQPAPRDIARVGGLDIGQELAPHH